MSITFTVEGERANYDEVFDHGAEPNYLNLANQNAWDLLRFLGFELDEDLACSGVLLPGDLRTRCVRRLSDSPVNFSDDLARAQVDIHPEDQCRQIRCGRSAGYLRDRAAELLKLAERAGDRPIVYS